MLKWPPASELRSCDTCWCHPLQHDWHHAEQELYVVLFPFISFGCDILSNLACQSWVSWYARALTDLSGCCHRQDSSHCWMQIFWTSSVDSHCFRRQWQQDWDHPWGSPVVDRWQRDDRQCLWHAAKGIRCWHYVYQIPQMLLQWPFCLLPFHLPDLWLAAT